MVEAPSSNLGTSTRNDSKQFFWTVRHEESVFICFLHWLGTSTVRQGKVDLKRWKIGC
jgi:hypothetical protein